MKSFIGLFFLIALLERSRSYKIDVGNVLPSMRGGSNEAKCYGDYAANITELAELGKKKAQDCETTTDSYRKEEVQKANKERLLVEERVQSIQKSLNCTTEEDIIEYLDCIQNGAQDHERTISEISCSVLNTKEALLAAYDAIQVSLDNCLRSVGDMVKSQSEILSNTLLQCVTGE